jgi:hypothetical protein
MGTEDTFKGDGKENFVTDMQNSITITLVDKVGRLADHA